MHKKAVMVAVMLSVVHTGSVFAQIGFATIRENMNKMTDVQFKQYAKSLEGQNVTWVGWVEEAKQKLFGGHECWVDMDAPQKLSVQDVTFDVSEAVALKLQKDKRLEFTGTIKSVLNVLGSCQVSLANARILKQEQ